MTSSRRWRSNSCPSGARAIFAGRAQVREHSEYAPVVVSATGRSSLAKIDEMCFSTALGVV
jgi:hypothetical protein